VRRSNSNCVSVLALASTGRVGYLFRQGSQSCLVVRIFNINPSGKYVDLWGTRVEDDGYAIQACNIHSNWGTSASWNTTRQPLAEIPASRAVMT